MIKLLIFFTLFISFACLADDLSKDQILGVLQDLKAQGMIPADKAPEVEKAIKEMSPENLSKIQGVARGVAEKSPESKSEKPVSASEVANSVDMESKDFKDAQSEIDKIMQ